MKQNIVICEPKKEARKESMELSLENLQQTVGGYIEVVYLHDTETPAVIVCNEEGRLLNLPANRILHSEYGDTMLYGTFLICGLDTEEGDFDGLTDELADRYLKLFKNPA